MEEHNRRVCMPPLATHSTHQHAGVHGTDLLSSREIMSARSQNDASCIPPVPSKVKALVERVQGSKIPKPMGVPCEVRSKLPAVSRWKMAIDCSSESPKGMDPCRFASIKGKFEEMQKRSNESYEDSGRAIRELRHSLPVQRSQRIAESLARMEKDFPEVDSSVPANVCITRIREEVEQLVSELKACSEIPGVEDEAVLTSSEHCIYRDVGLIGNPDVRRSMIANIPMASLRQPDGLSKVSVDGCPSYQDSLSSPAVSASNSHIDIIVNSSVTGRTYEETRVRRPLVVDSAFSTMGRNAVPSFSADTRCSNSLADSTDYESCHNESYQSFEDGNTMALTRNYIGRRRDSCRHVSGRRPGSAESSRMCSSRSRTISAGCAPEMHKLQRSSKTLSQGRMASCDSMWSIELSEFLALTPDVDESSGQNSENSTTDGTTVRGRDGLVSLGMVNSDLEFQNMSQMRCRRNVRTPIGNGRGGFEEPGDVSHSQAMELARKRVLLWNSAPDIISPCTFDCVPTLDTLSEEKVSQFSSNMQSQNDGTSSISGSLFTGQSETSCGIVNSTPEMSGSIPSGTRTASNTIVTKWDQQYEHRKTMSMDSRSNPPQARTRTRTCQGFVHQVACEDQTFSRSRNRREKPKSFAMCDFTFTTQEASSSRRGEAEDETHHDPNSLRDVPPLVQGASGTVTCSTPTTLRSPEPKPKQGLYSRVISMLKIVVPSKAKEKKASLTPHQEHFSCAAQVSRKNTFKIGCLPRRFTLGLSNSIGKEPKRECVKKRTNSFKGKVRWWKCRRRSKQDVCFCLDSCDTSGVRNAESSVHKYSRRHVFLMDKIEHERLGSGQLPKSGEVCKTDTDPWLSGLNTL